MYELYERGVTAIGWRPIATTTPHSYIPDMARIANAPRTTASANTTAATVNAVRTRRDRLHDGHRGPMAQLRQYDPP